ncbi:MAG TPA: PAS domain-containing protein [Longimicrobiales bacterium]
MTAHSRLITAGELTSERVKRFHDYWRSKCKEGSPPERAAIDQAEIPRLLPYIVMAEIEPEPFRIRYRLVESRVAESHGADYTNRCLDECGFAVEPLLNECYRRRSSPITNGTSATGVGCTAPWAPAKPVSFR